jgi:hypothetical protein
MANGMYTQEGIMAQIYVAFGQGTGAVRVSQGAALELYNLYFAAIPPAIESWGTEAAQVLERIRAIGRLAAIQMTLSGETAISAEGVQSAAVIVQLKSDTDFCPPPPKP